ncbi:MAG: hypothetical protein K9N23_18730 [Akkermansiaceae bacterium]|nr:hypothetical protein [Akkermansiaceae bacterium]MCF7733731.1 hypothetical protein [Akkermansiaceae bacterium]
METSGSLPSRVGTPTRFSWRIQVEPKSNYKLVGNYMPLGSSQVEGLHGMGAGFLIKGKARFVMSGPDFDFMKEKFGWLRATLAITIETATQTW